MNQPSLEQISPKKGKPVLVKVLIILALILVVGVGGLMVFLKVTGAWVENNGESLIENLIETAIENDTGKKPNVDIDVNDGKMVIRDRDTGEMVNIRVSERLPENFPKDIPIYKDSKIEGNMDMGQMTVVTLTTKAKASQVNEYYKTELSDEGWETKGIEMPNPSQYMGLFNKKDKELTVTIGEEEGETTIVLTFGVPTYE